MTDLRKQFDLGLLPSATVPVPSGSREPPPESAYARAVDDALVLYGAPILEAVRSGPVRAHDLAARLRQQGINDLSFEQLLAVLRLLRDRGFVTLDDELEPTGNWLVTAGRRR